MTFSRITKFLKQYLLNHPLYTVTYAVTYPLKGFAFHAPFYTENEVKNLLQKGKSIIRLGDGEINLLLDLKNHYHFFSPRLKTMMKEIIAAYSPNSPYILSVPRFVNFSNRDLELIGKLNVWMPFKVMFLLLFPKKVAYMDAHNFYYNKYFENVIAPIFNEKTVICVTNKQTIERQKNNPNIPWKSIVYIEAPERDALNQYKEMQQSIDTALAGLLPQDIVLFFAIGPVGKYLIFTYSQKGYQGIDIGKGLEVIFTPESIEYLSI